MGWMRGNGVDGWLLGEGGCTVTSASASAGAKVVVCDCLLCLSAKLMGLGCFVTALNQWTVVCVQEDWSLFMANKRRFIKLKMTEFDEEFSDEMAEGIVVS